MRTPVPGGALTTVFSELVEGTTAGTESFILNPGDAGLLRSLDKLSAADASRSVNGGATIAAHARHLQYGLSLMNRWADEGGIHLRMRHGTKPGRRRRSMPPSGREFGPVYATKRGDG